VHINQAKSLATIEVKGKFLPFIPNDDIEGMAILLKVERRRIIFRNSANGLNEYIEMKEGKGLSFGFRKDSPSSPTTSAPDQKDFSFNRNEVNGMIRNLPELLQQARAEPKVLPGGKIDGFCMVDIMPGSIYEKIGLKVGDCIKGVNGETLDSPAKAMEMYQQLRTSNRIQIEIDRNGSKETLTYTIN
jgi:general secretion pathway protein C